MLILLLLLMGWRLPLNFQTFASYYSLFFFIVGTTALIYGIDENTHFRKGFWALAGVSGFFCFFFKQSMGIYYGFASFFLVAILVKTQKNGLRGRSLLFLGGVIILGCLLKLLWPFMSVKYFIIFLLPILLLIYTVGSKTPLPVLPGTCFTWGSVVTYLAAYGIPLLMFARLYLAKGGLTDWFLGIFIRPQLHLETGFWPLRTLDWHLLISCLLFLLPIGASLLTSRTLRYLSITFWVGTLICLLAVASSGTAIFFTACWQFVTYLPWLTFIWFWLTRTKHTKPIIWLVWIFNFFLYLVIYPLSCDVYQCYALPLGWILFNRREQF